MMFEATNYGALTDAERLARLLDKDEIRSVIARSCRAIDRLDAALLASCFHPDATVNYAPFYVGSAQGLIESLSHAGNMFEKSQYMSGTQLIEVDSDTGRAETYVWCCRMLPERNESGDQMGRLSGLRYVEKHERRDREWRILHRTVIAEWGRFVTFPAQTEGVGMFKAPGEWDFQPIVPKRDRSDISYHID